MEVVFSERGTLRSGRYEVAAKRLDPVAFYTIKARYGALLVIQVDTI